MVPLRIIAETLGADVQWDEINRTIYIIKKETLIISSSNSISLTSNRIMPEGWEVALLVKDIDYGKGVIIRRENGEVWYLKAKTYCLWAWRHKNKYVFLKFGRLSSILINEDGEVSEFWTKEMLK